MISRSTEGIRVATAVNTDNASSVLCTVYKITADLIKATVYWFLV